MHVLVYTSLDFQQHNQCTEYIVDLVIYNINIDIVIVQTCTYAKQVHECQYMYVCFFMLSVFKHDTSVSRVDFLPIQWFAMKETWHITILCPIQPPEFHGTPNEKVKQRKVL